jgi:hypothetical protein
MKNNPISKKRYGYSLIILLIFINSCIDNNPQTQEDNRYEDTHGQSLVKTISEVILVDNGAVVPKPMTRRVVWAFKNSENILLTYTEQNGGEMQMRRSDMTVSDETRDEVRDEIERVAEIVEDGLAIKPGKQPCVGMNSMNVAIVYNTGDTSRIAISGSVRCDPTLYPSIWALDSMATEMFRKSKPQ